MAWHIGSKLPGNNIGLKCLMVSCFGTSVPSLSEVFDGMAACYLLQLLFVRHHNMIISEMLDGMASNVSFVSWSLDNSICTSHHVPMMHPTLCLYRCCEGTWSAGSGVIGCVVNARSLPHRSPPRSDKCHDSLRLHRLDL
eukprot:5430618-Amphidinium_carterae.1